MILFAKKSTHLILIILSLLCFSTPLLAQRSPFGDEQTGVYPPPLPGFGVKENYTLESVDGVERLPRCMAYDSSEYVRQIPWPASPLNLQECSLGANIGEEMKEKIIKSCKKAGREELTGKSDPYEKFWKDGLSWDTPYEVIMSIQEWPAALDKKDMAKGYAINFAKCVITGAVEGMDASPGQKAHLKRVVEAGFESYAVYDTVTGLANAHQEAHKALKDGAKWTAAFKGVHIGSSLAKFIERSQKIVAPMLESDSAKKWKSSRNKQYYNKLLNEDCNPEYFNKGEFQNDLKEMQAFLKYLREEFAYMEKNILCARYARLSLRHKGPSKELTSILDQSESLASLATNLNTAQCELAEMLDHMHKLKTDDLPKLTEKKKATKQEYSALLKEFYGLRRKQCDITPAETKRENDVLYRMLDLKASFCGEDLEPDPRKVAERTRPSEQEKQEVEEFKRTFNAALSACIYNEADSALSQLRHYGKRAAWECHLRDLVAQYEKDIAKITDDEKTLKDYFSTQVPAEDSIIAALDKCDFVAADRLVLQAVEKLGGASSLPLNIRACFKRFGEAESHARIGGLRKVNDGRRSEFEQLKQALLSEISHQVEIAQSHIDMAEQNPATRCRFFEQAIDQANTISGMLAFAPPFSQCPIGDKLDAQKNRAQAIAKEAKAQLGDKKHASRVNEISSFIKSCKYEQAQSALDAIKPIEGICDPNLRTQFVELEQQLQGTSQNKELEARILAAYTKKNATYLACDTKGFRETAVPDISDCEAMSLSVEAREKLASIKKWGATIDNIDSGVSSFLAAFERARQDLTLCRISASEGGAKTARSELTKMMLGAPESCHAAIPAVAEFEVLEGRITRMANVKSEIYAKAISLDSSAHAMRREFEGREPSPSTLQMHKDKISSLRNKMSELESYANPVLCDREVTDAIERARASIALIRTPELHSAHDESPQLFDEELQDFLRRAEQDGDDSIRELRRKQVEAERRIGSSIRATRSARTSTEHEIGEALHRSQQESSERIWQGVAAGQAFDSPPPTYSDSFPSAAGRAPIVRGVDTSAPIDASGRSLDDYIGAAKGPAARQTSGATLDPLPTSPPSQRPPVPSSVSPSRPQPGFDRGPRTPYSSGGPGVGEFPIDPEKAVTNERRR